MVTRTPDERRTYLLILADGRFHQKVAQNTEGAVYRTWEKADGTKGESYDLIFRSIKGFIVNINFIEGDYGEQMQLTLDDKSIITIGSASRFASDIMKRLPNVNFDKEVEFAPWSFNDEDRKKSGCILKQDDEKIESYFESQSGDGKWIVKNGFPTTKSDQTKTQWKKYFMDVQTFLTDYIKENICPTLNNKPTIKETERLEIDPLDIPF